MQENNGKNKPRPTKYGRIIEMLTTTSLTYEEIASVVGSHPIYVARCKSAFASGKRRKLYFYPKDRSQYYRNYHQVKQATDQAYVERKRAAARLHQRKLRREDPDLSRWKKFKRAQFAAEASEQSEVQP